MPPPSERGVDVTKKHGCYNRKPFLDTQFVQNGWTEDGRKIVEQIPFRMSRHCEYDDRTTDPGCEGCCWQKETKDRFAILGEEHGN